MQLVEKAEISLDDSVQTYIPNFPYHDISIRYLLSHKSGLPEYWYFTDSLWNDWSNPLTNDDVLCLFEENCPNVYYLPGRRYNYINSNFVLLASIVSMVSEMPFGAYVEQNIFRPAEMNHSFIYNEYTQPQLKYQGVVGHEWNKRHSEISYLNGVVGDKGAYCSATDLYNFDRALRNGVLLKDYTQKLMYTPQHDNLYDWDNYALGWRIDFSDTTNTVVYHNGWWKGFKTSFIRELDNDKTIIVLSNYLRRGHFNVRELRSFLHD